jgi:hypothetical protein
LKASKGISWMIMKEVTSIDNAEQVHPGKFRRKTQDIIILFSFLKINKSIISEIEQSLIDFGFQSAP